MTLEPGDVVRTVSGEIGRIVHFARLTVFLQMESEDKDATLKAFLMSDVTKIEPPPSALI